MKIFTLIMMLLIQSSCGHIQFDVNGVGTVVVTQNTGCMSDSDCVEGKTCATVKGEFPGSCASRADGQGDILLGVIGAAAAATALSQGGGSGGGGYTVPSNSYYRTPSNQNDTSRGLQGCCSHYGGISYCSGGTLYCTDGWVSRCRC